MFSVIGALGAILFLIGAVAWIVRRALGIAPIRGGGPALAVAQRIPVGPRQGIAVLAVGERRVAVSVGEGGVRYLFELDPATDANDAPATPMRSVAESFAGVLRKAAGRGVVALLLAALAALPTSAARAQAATAAPAPATAQRSPAAAITAPQKPSATPLPPRLDLNLSGSGANDGLKLSGSVGVVVLMGLLSLLPTLVLMTTSFTRILIVLQFLKQAIGTQNAPPAQLVAGLALILSGFVMMPTMTKVNRDALTPWLDGRISQAEMLDKASVPMREFMVRQTRPADIDRFVRMSGTPAVASVAEVPFITLMAAFTVSELRTAFTMGFALFLPFIVIDLVTSSVLMSLGMFMLPPATVALPFKLLLFVLVDGWGLMAQSLVTSFR